MAICTCRICEISFSATRSDAKYCSDKCRNRQETIRLAKRKQEELAKELIPTPCKVCGDMFIPSKFRKDQMYCGSKCLNKAMGERQSNRDGYKEYKSEYDKKYRVDKAHIKRKIDMNYKDKIRFGGNKYKVLERDGHKCVKCGKDNPRSLIIHHKDHSGSSNNPNNDMDNLETLCRSCHMKHHSHKDPNHIMYHRKKARLEKES